MRPICVMLSVLIIACGVSALEPREVFVIYNRNLPESVKLAKYYASVRKIPRDNLIGIRTTTNERISRADYLKTVRDPVRKALLTRSRMTRVRCLVTVRGVPLAINQIRAEVERKAYRQAGRRCTECKAKLVALRNRLQELGNESPVDVEAVGTLKQEIEKGEKNLAALTAARDEALKKLRAKNGQTNAALDSELALLFWSPYQLRRWQPNFLRTILVKTPATSNSQITFMTARLDGPDFKSVKGMINRAVAAEKKGLEGVAYFDARGLKPKGSRPSAYAIHDEAIRQTAEMVKAHGIKTVLDNRPELFGPGKCPDAALYCGWYSLTKYVDAFDWAAGAVGYHVASGEAISLRRGNYWCKRMIDDRVTATLGPVNEPYLSAFPDPRAFFGLLLTGKYTLVEVYAETGPWNSWMMTLIGDPLYNPFRKNPKMTLDEVKAAVSKPLRKPKADNGKPKAGQ